MEHKLRMQEELIEQITERDRISAMKERMSVPKEREESKKPQVVKPKAPLVTTKDLNAYASQNNRDRPMSEQERKDLHNLIKKLSQEQIAGIVQLLSDVV